MSVPFHTFEESLSLEITHHRLPRIIPVEPCIFAAIFIDGGVLVEDIYRLQSVPFGYLKVVEVVGRGHLYSTSTKFWVHVVIAHNRYHPVDQGQ